MTAPAPSTHSPPRVFLAGCGDIGLRVAALCRAEGAVVSALARSDAAAARLAAAGISPVRGDLDDPSSLASLDVSGAVVHYQAPPPESGETDPRAAAFLDAVPPGGEPARIVYVSTTGVYGDARGGWVDEETPAVPATARGKRRLDAERAFLAFGRARGVAVVVLRVAGIYGPGRLPLERLRSGEPVVREEEAPWSNRIHADDLARACVAAGLRGRPGAVYNASDGAPGTLTQYMDAVAELFALPRPPRVSMEEARRVLGPGILSYLAESKRVDSRRMREELLPDLLYPDLASGLAACLRAQG